MSDSGFRVVARLEQLAAWHRLNAEHAGADWIWEARLLAAERLERKASELRAGQTNPGSSREA